MYRYLLLLAVLLTSCVHASNEQPQTVSHASTHSVKTAPVIAKPLAKGHTPKHVIYMIGDGMGVEQVSAAWVCNKGKLNITRLPITGISKTYSADHLVTDSAAGGTALACGRRTNNKWLGLSPDRKPLQSLADIARSQGKATGLVVTKAITDATPAAFYAHVDGRDKTEQIAEQLSRTPFNIVIGCGAGLFTPEQMERMESTIPLLHLTPEKQLPPATERGGFLPEQTAAALAELEKAPKGFFLMIEGSQIDVAGHSHDLKEVVAEVLDFDRAVGVVLDWMETHPDTLLVITADHQTGGLVILDGDIASGRVKGVFSAPSHNGLMVPIYAAGPGAALFSGVHDNTDIPNLLRGILTGE